MATPVLAPIPVVLGVDISHFQHPHGAAIDWTQVAASGRSFAIVKASEGTSTAGAELFSTDYQAIADAGMLRGAYHFFRASSSGSNQADTYLAKVSDLFDPSDLRPALDVEQEGWAKSTMQPSQIVEQVRAWLDAVETALGVRPMIYTDPGSWKSLASPDFTDYPLWMARVGLGGTPISAINKAAPIKPWTEYQLWQFSWSGTIPGIQGAVDEDRFYGDLDGLISSLTVST